jgi:vesicle transport protein SEC22
MLLITMIARLDDAMPLTASLPEDAVLHSRFLLDYQNKAKQLFRKINQNSTDKGSVETGPYIFQ